MMLWNNRSTEFCLQSILAVMRGGDIHQAIPKPTRHTQEYCGGSEVKAKEQWYLLAIASLLLNASKWILFAYKNIGSLTHILRKCSSHSNADTANHDSSEMLNLHQPPYPNSIII